MIKKTLLFILDYGPIILAIVLTFLGMPLLFERLAQLFGVN